MQEKILLKDAINENAISQISGAIKEAYPSFQTKLFKKECLQNIEALELKQRILHIIKVLHCHLPKDFIATAAIFFQLKQQWKSENKNGLKGFNAWPIIDYVAVYGLDHPEIALKLLAELTPLFSAEFAIRPFIIHHFAITYAHLEKWCESEDEHIRRLVSEGSRPRLPWGQRLPDFCLDPSPILPMLDKLKADKSLYVRRSVANNLNDIAKDNPGIVIKLCEKWQKKSCIETDWIIRHATRSLVKNGHSDVFNLLGYSEEINVRIEDFSIDKTHLHLGDDISFSLKLSSTSKQSQKFVIDYAIHHVKASGKITAKVFKLKDVDLSGKKTIEIQKKHSFKKITTRKYYAGKHSIEILINGKSQKLIDFHLTT